jgi:hypothetical protein
MLQPLRPESRGLVGRAISPRLQQAIWTSRDITQIWYPSYCFHEKDGNLTGAYLGGQAEGDFRIQNAADGWSLHSTTAGDFIRVFFTGHQRRVPCRVQASVQE